VPVTYPQLEQASPPDPGQACPGARIILSVAVGPDGSVLACRVLTATAPACQMPKSAGTNSGPFLSQTPTLSPRLTPKADRNRWATRRVCPQNRP